MLRQWLFFFNYSNAPVIPSNSNEFLIRISLKNPTVGLLLTNTTG